MSRWKCSSCLAIPKATHQVPLSSLSVASFGSRFLGPLFFATSCLGSAPRSFAMGKFATKEKTSSSNVLRVQSLPVAVRMSQSSPELRVIEISH